MSMCYLCDLCRHFVGAVRINGFHTGDYECSVLGYSFTRKAFDYGCDDPREICVHFEPKEGSE